MVVAAIEDLKVSKLACFGLMAVWCLSSVQATLYSLSAIAELLVLDQYVVNKSQMHAR